MSIDSYSINWNMIFNGYPIFDLVNEYSFFKVFTVGH